MDSTEAASARLLRRSVLAGGAAVVGGVLVGRSDAAAQTAPADSVFNVKDPAYAGGAKGDFWTNDTPAIQAAINAALGAGGGIVWFPAGSYRLTTSLKLNGPSFNAFDKPITLQGVGDASVLLATNTASGSDPNWKFVGDRLLEANGRPETESGVATGAAIPAGSRQVVVPQALADTLTVNSIVGIEDANGDIVYGTKARPFELHRVVSRSGTNGTTLDLDSPLLHSYTGQAIVYKVTSVQGPCVRDLAITAVWDPLQNPGIYAIWLCWATHVRVENVRISNAAGGIVIRNVVDGNVTDCVIDGLPKTISSDVSPHGPSYGYGVAATGATAGLTVDGLVGRFTRHLFTTLSDQRSATEFFGGPRNVTVVGGIGEGGLRGGDPDGPKAIWDTHEFGTDIAFIGCSAIGVGTPASYPGFNVRAKNVRIVDCVAKYNNYAGIRVDAIADHTRISGGELAYNGDHGITAASSITVDNVEIHHNGGYGITWGSGAPVVTITNCSIHDNEAPGVRDQAPNGGKSPNVVITGNIIPKGTDPQFPQANSIIMIGGPNAVIANNVLRGYGASNDGTAVFEPGAPVVKQSNVVGP